MVAHRGFADVDMAAVRLLSRDLYTIRSRLSPAMRVATSKSAARIKAQAKANIKSQTTGKHTKWYPAAITQEMKLSNASHVMAEVGAAKYAKQGFLATILEFGSVNNPPKPHLIPAFTAEIPGYVDAMGLAGQWAVLP